MKTTNAFGVRFFVKNHLINYSEVPIYVRVTVDGIRVDISLKRKINIYDWNPQSSAFGTRK